MLIAKFDTYGVSGEISKIESRHSITFPEQYKNFLLRYNGGYTPKTKFRAKNRINYDRARQIFWRAFSAL